MISLDGSIIPAIIIFLTVVIALNQLLFRPLVRVQAEREARTTGTVALAHERMRHCGELFDQYEAAIKNARAEGYRIQEQARSEALKKRDILLDLARKRAEQLMNESRDSIRNQVHAAKMQLGHEAQEIARAITAAVLKRSA